MISEKMIDMIEKNGWSCFDNTGNYVELNKYSPLGEDFIITVKAKDDNEFAIDLVKLYNDFDPDEHAARWIEEKMDGSDPCLVNCSVLDLAKDAIDIKNMLKKLAGEVSVFDLLTIGDKK